MKILILSIIATLVLFGMFAFFFGVNPLQWTSEQSIIFVLATVIVDSFISSKSKES